MKRLILAAAVTTAVIAALTVPTAAWADTSIVGVGGCAAQGGHVDRPAGTEIVVRLGDSFRYRGLGVDFLGAQSTNISVNGGSPVNVSGQYGDLVFVTLTTDLGAVYSELESQILYPTGVTLAVGESMTFHLVQTLAHRVPDYSISESGEWSQVFFDGPGTYVDVTCTVTGI
jgi:hypothetical protein